MEGKHGRAGARAETARDHREPLTVRAAKEGATMYELPAYPIAPNLWRWEICCGSALLRCGTTRTKAAAELAVNEIANT
jgi:hypothetical protein